MKFLSIIFSFSLLVLYGYLVYYFFAPIDITSYHTPKTELLNEYDYIVIGAGAAGSVVSSRLAQNNFKVLLVEAGGSDFLSEVSMPIGLMSLLSQSKFRNMDWGDHTIFEKENIKNKIYIARTKMVGGCGSVNAMVWNRGNHKIYDKWDHQGAKGWKYNDIKKYFQKAEGVMWLEKESRFIHQSMKDVLEEGKKIFGYAESFSEKTHGFNLYVTNTRNGRRWSSSDAYLKPTLRKYKENLHLQLNSSVSSIIFNEAKTKATHVQLEDGRKFKAKKEIIISAGAINSPLILLRSGIGNSTKLSALGIKTLRDLPGVGENLQDHPTTRVIFSTNEPKWVDIEKEPPNFTRMIEYLIFGTGPLTSNTAEVGGYTRSKFAQFKDIDDIQFHCAPAFFGSSDMIAERQSDNKKENYISCLVSLVTPRNNGSIQIKSATDIKSRPEITLNFLDTEEDFNSLLEGIKAIEKIMEGLNFKGKTEIYFPKKIELNDKNLLKKYVLKSLFEAHHPVGTCRMGDFSKNTNAVVDNHLKVTGFDNLRVIDASVMPLITNANTYATTVMIAEKGADLILENEIRIKKI